MRAHRILKSWIPAVLFLLSVPVLADRIDAGGVDSNSDGTDGYGVRVLVGDDISTSGAHHKFDETGPASFIERQLRRMENPDGAWNKAVNYGQILMRYMRDPTCMGRLQYSSFTYPDQLEHWGWRESWREAQNIGEEEADGRALLSLGLPLGEDDNLHLSWIHSQDSEGADGHLYPSTDGIYSQLYNKAGAIVIESIESPVVAGLECEPQVKGADLVPLRAWSDVTYLLWERYQSGDKEAMRKLKCVLHRGVINRDTLRVIHRILNSEILDWPGRDFSTSEQAGQALLGTPNGRGTGWMLAQHQDVFSGRIVQKMSDRSLVKGVIDCMLDCEVCGTELGKQCIRSTKAAALGKCDNRRVVLPEPDPGP